jgi:hypothetical protein
VQIVIRGAKVSHPFLGASERKSFAGGRRPISQPEERESFDPLKRLGFSIYRLRRDNVGHWRLG